MSFRPVQGAAVNRLTAPAVFTDSEPEVVSISARGNRSSSPLPASPGVQQNQARVDAAVSSMASSAAAAIRSDSPKMAISIRRSASPVSVSPPPPAMSALVPSFMALSLAAAHLEDEQISFSDNPEGDLPDLEKELLDNMPRKFSCEMDFYADLPADESPKRSPDDKCPRRSDDWIGHGTKQWGCCGVSKSYWSRWKGNIIQIVEIIDPIDPELPKMDAETAQMLKDELAKMSYPKSFMTFHQVKVDKKVSRDQWESQTTQYTFT